jgi:hypothetical protein
MGVVKKHKQSSQPTISTDIVIAVPSHVIGGSSRLSECRQLSTCILLQLDFVECRTERHQAITLSFAGTVDYDGICAIAGGAVAGCWA